MVIDFRALNEKTIGVFSSKHHKNIRSGSAKYFSVFDLASDFHQISSSIRYQLESNA